MRLQFLAKLDRIGETPTPVSVPDVDDNPPDEQWNGTETGSEWFWRTRDAQTQPLLGGSWTSTEGDSIADHPDDCPGTCCKDALREAPDLVSWVDRDRRAIIVQVSR